MENHNIHVTNPQPEYTYTDTYQQVKNSESSIARLPKGTHHFTRVKAQKWKEYFRVNIDGDGKPLQDA
jgi:hypothetical protein